MLAKLLLVSRGIGHCCFQSAKSKANYTADDDDSPPKQGMHCLGAAGSTGGEQASPSSGFGSRGGVISVVRALGVLVCEGRIQGPPRGYKEGPHCVPPLQPAPSNHTCDNDNYLCDRYLVLVREITERVAAGSLLSVEVVLCSDCACGLKKSKSKHRVLGTPDKTPWQQHSSEMLLEYWSISVVPSKSPETMNSQGLYQAVRSRLHFSQVAAWWSRTNGVKPNYIATRIVQQQDDHLRKFREPPVEHTFPLAGTGDGNSIKVTVWALPRMEDIPRLQCPLHLAQPEEQAKPLEHCVRASTPTKPLATATLVTSPSSSNTVLGAIADAAQHQNNHLVMPALLDDRLQIPCDKPGKHHCRCADEEDDDVEEVQPSASQAQRPNGERKRRRSLPCRPPDSPSNGPAAANPSNPSNTNNANNANNANPAASQEHSSSGLPPLKEVLLLPGTAVATATTAADGSAGLDALERSFRTQLSIDDQQERSEKRYKRSDSHGPSSPSSKQHQQQQQQQQQQSATSVGNTHVPSLIPWVSYSANGNTVTSVLPVKNQNTGAHASNGSGASSSTSPNVNLVVNPFHAEKPLGRPACPADDLDKDKQDKPDKQDQASILEWITRVPARVLGSANEYSNNAKASPPAAPSSTPPKSRNNLDLSPREFDEVLAVLRARTPLGRRRAAVRTAKRREKYDRLVNETQQQLQQQQQQQNQQQQPSKSTENCAGEVENKADVLLGAILRSSSRDKNDATTEATSVDAPASTTEETKPRNASPESCASGNVFPPSNVVDTSLPASLNKRLLRLRQLFKRYEHDKLIQAEDGQLPRGESRVKRRIDFSSEEADAEAKLEDGQTHSDCSVGTSTNGSAHANSALHSTNGELDSAECCANGGEKKKKTRGRRDLSPIWVNHNNNHVDAKDKKDCASAASEHQEEHADKTIVPTAKDQERFRRSLENAASMVFHSRTGLPLTSSPAPLRRGSCCFDFDSSLNSVSSKRSALFELNTPPSPGAVSLEEGDRETENACDIEEVTRRRSTSRNRPQSHALLGSFEESALNGRLEPVSTVHGFTAEIGASGSFCPKHRKLPVTVFFYTLGDNDKVSSPYLAHINLGKKGYQVPRSGTIQVTLSNPLGTVVKMFVVLYDLSDMPPRSHTFLRQRTLRDKTLRYLIHLRFMSGKSGRIYLHTDIRIIICRKSDVDTASDFGSEPPKELRSYIHGPTNPKFSPRC